MTDLGGLEYFKLGINFASYLYFPAAPALVWLAAKRTGLLRWAALAFLTVISLFAYGRFVEPRILIAPEYNVTLDRCFAESGAVRVAVASDFHIGLFGNAMPIDRIAARINKANPDFVLLAGDFIYFLDPARYDAAFGAFGAVDAPVYGVLGNHDFGLPGPDQSGVLQSALPSLGVRLVDDSRNAIAVRNSNLEIVGLSDDWAGHQDLALLEAQTTSPRIVLTHNAASVRDFSPDAVVDLLVAGHTHGGQINLPGATCLLTTMCGKRRYGLSRGHESYPLRGGIAQHNENQTDARRDSLIFTTSGTGMVGLPMRFRVPPRIDMLNIRWHRCETEIR